MCEVLYGDAKVDASVSDRGKPSFCLRCFAPERKCMNREKIVGLGSF